MYAAQLNPRPWHPDADQRPAKRHARRRTPWWGVLLALVLAFPMAPASAQGTLYLFNWAEYMDPAIIHAFEQKFDVHVVQSFYESNPDLFAKLRAGGASQYDVVVPSNDFIPRLVASHLLQPLDHNAIPNLAHLKPRFRDPVYDPGNRYSAAYQWGDTGLVYNSDAMPSAPASWAILFDPKINATYPFALGEDPLGPLGAACAYQGHGYDCHQRPQWIAAAHLVIATKNRPNFAAFVDGTQALQRLAQGSLYAAAAFNGDFVASRARNPRGFAHLKFIIPREGAELWVDNMAIPVHAPHPRLANAFINFMLDAHIGAQLSNWTRYATPNQPAQALLDPALKKPPVTPTPQQMKRLHFAPILAGDSLQFVQQLWTDVQAR